jgi:hypothetical protein
MAHSSNSRTLQRTARPRARGVVNLLQKPGTFLHMEVRGSTASYFVEPGAIPIRKRYAEQAIGSGLLVAAGYDLFGAPASWSYAPKSAPEDNTNSRGQITRAKTAPR